MFAKISTSSLPKLLHFNIDSRRAENTCEPIVIPQDAMTRFIGATQASANPKYYAMDEISDLMCGRNIRMIGGVLDGYEGKLQTIRGSKTKHLIIILPSLLAVSVEINDEYIELL